MNLDLGEQKLRGAISYNRGAALNHKKDGVRCVERTLLSRPQLALPAPYQIMCAPLCLLLAAVAAVVLVNPRNVNNHFRIAILIQEAQLLDVVQMYSVNVDCLSIQFGKLRHVDVDSFRF